MKIIKNYYDFIIEFNNLPNSVKDEIIDRKSIDGEYISVNDYISKNGDKFTFKILRMIFEESIADKNMREIKKGSYKMAHRLLPAIGALFFPVFSLIGVILGNTRAINKIIKPVIKDPSHNYPEFLKKLIVITMNIAEGDIKPFLGHDKFYDAFVITDKTIKMIRKDVLRDFSIYLDKRIINEDENDEVPKSYIENELKNYLNNRFEITPPMLYEDGHIPK